MRQAFIDLGANEGHVSFDFALHNPTFEIYCVEPNATLIPRIVERTLGLTNLVTIVRAAAWITDGVVELFQSTSHVASTVVKGKVEYQNWPQIDYDRPVNVPCFDFSQWLVRNFALNDEVTVKMDIEGSEYDVLEKMVTDGSIKLVRKLICEWHADRYPHIEAERHKTLKERVGSLTTLEDWF